MSCTINKDQMNKFQERLNSLFEKMMDRALVEDKHPVVFTAPKTGNYTVTAPKGYNIIVDEHLKDSHVTYTTTSNSIFKWPDNLGKSDWQVDLATPVQPVMCECGSHKTYGESCAPEFHSTFCPLYRKA